MEYDFTTVLDRAGHDCTAADIIPFPDFTVDEGFSVIPMWVADMSFPVAPPILKAVQDRLSFPFWAISPCPTNITTVSSAGRAAETASRS